MKDKQDTMTPKQRNTAKEIAIVGVSLRFPGANSKETFWHNLTNKVSSISEIPASRWRWQDDFDPTPKKDEQKIISKWGGFIDNMDGFDASFFAISPKEAQSMDPQQRLSMELAWQCFEDAGLSPSTFKNTKTGVYLGCSNTDYQELATGNIDPHFLTGMSTGVFANRISHYFNLQGPSETVDTACSSSLVALHKAVNDFKTGEINAALVGGVNLLITKSRYVSFSKLGVLSPQGRCKTLDADADGYVRGEGVGMVLLLPLERALAENLTIYGVIKGSSVGHSGQTNTLTSPNPFSQSRVIQEAIDNAGIHSDDLSYVELHGTGTRLGDPIEIQGLKRAFRATKSNKRQSNTCYLSTVKTNIGHLESAAGVAGIIKVLLSFKYQQIPPLQNFETLNPKISLNKSVFELATECVPWQSNKDKVRIAGISSFGFAGVNAHVILQSPPTQNTQQIQLNSPVTIVLSAKNATSLIARAKQLHTFITEQKLSESTLTSLAYTLQVGRENMAHRMGFMAESMQDVVAQLSLFSENQTGTWQQTKVDKDNTPPESQTSSNDLLAQWLAGHNVNWQSLYDAGFPQRLCLPGYPFAPKRYWIEQASTQTKTAMLHPLLHQALPCFDGLLFSSTFTGDEFFLADHQVQNERILPGVCSLEMVRAAVALSHDLNDSHSVFIENVKWLRPIGIKKNASIEQATLYLSIKETDNALAFEVYQKFPDGQQTCVTGEVIINELCAPHTSFDLNFELNNDANKTLSHLAIYEAFSKVGINYGPSFQGLQQTAQYGDVAIAQAKVAASYCQSFALSPAVLDAALQSLIVFAPDQQVALPFATQRVTYFNAKKLTELAPDEVKVKVTQTSKTTDNTQRFDLDVCDTNGTVLVRIEGFSTRALPIQAQPIQAQPAQIQPTQEATATAQSQDTLLTLKPCWSACNPITHSTKTANHWQYFGPTHLQPDWITPETDVPLNSTHLLWVAQEDYAQPLTLFNHLKSLLAQGLDLNSLSITLVTIQTQSVFGEHAQAQGAGLIGLLQSVAQEYPRSTVRIIDLTQHADIPSEVTQLTPGFYALRDAQWYNFSVATHHYLNTPTTRYKQQGTYLVLGGAGGLGQVWSEWMIKHYDAQIIWLGRRAANDEITTAISRLAKLGKAPVYMQCDAADKTAMAQVLKNISANVGVLNGVVHSILHLEDQTLANMNQAQFLESYSAKQQTGEVVLDLFSEAQLDFFLFFSSMQSFSPAPGQSNYAAGCTYLDSLALKYRNSCPIKIVNWGYWGSVGVVQDAFYQNKMRAVGIGSIEADEGMTALQQFMDSSLSQAGIIKILPAQFKGEFNRQSYSASGAQSDFACAPSLPLPAIENSNAQPDLAALCAALHKARWQQPDARAQALRKLPAYFQQWWAQTQHYLEANHLLQNGVLSDKYTSACEPQNTPTDLLSNCLANLPAILSGDIKATDAVFPNASLALVEAVYQNNPIADHANQVLITQLQAYLTQKQLKSVRVLEVGAGTGGTTRSVLPALAQWQVEKYAYTDLSKAFFNHAKAQYQNDYPFVETKYLDISKPLAAQHIDIGSYDVVIATNVLHATANIENTLQNVKACLKTGGLLLINEVVQTSLFTHLTFGLLEGWWLSEDKHLRLAGSPMLSIATWQHMLSKLGFTTQTAADSQCPQQIFCALSDGQITQQCAAKSPKPVNTKQLTQNMANKQQATEQAQTLNTHNTHVDESTIHDFVQNALFDIASTALGMPASELDADESFADYGVDSILAIQMLDDINAKFELNLPATLLFDYPSIEALATHIIQAHKNNVIALMPTQATQTQQVHAHVQASTSNDARSLRKHTAHAAPSKQEVTASSSQSTQDKIAIVGMSGQFGDADNVDEFWSMLVEKRTSVKEQTRWSNSKLNNKELSWSRYASLINDISLFDAPFFSITPQEAMYMDPQQRLFLQQAYKALEDANMITQVSGQNVGVYLGCAQSDYADMADRDAPAQLFWGNAGSVIPARVSYFLNLKGPALAIDTACSSSLVAIHSACQALNNHEISSALVGGVATLCTPKFSIYAGKAGMLSPDGTCYTFDDRANGFVPGEGAGVLVLKRLADAERDNDHIYGVILGSATNQDGTTSGITAPNSLSQEQLHRDIYARFDIKPDSIQMIEAHGTGTRLGDPIEFQALTRTFREHTNKSSFCALGSVKTNIGHCLTAAGVAGVIKALLAMKHQTIPASLHFEQGNSYIDWQDSPFFVNQNAVPWQAETNQKRRAAVSSFGFSGTNAHVILEEYQAKPAQNLSQITSPVVITLSAKSQDALIDKAKQLQAWIQHEQLVDTQLAALAYTLQSAREEMDHRLALCASSVADVQKHLGQFLNDARGNYKQGEVKQGKEILSALDSSDFARWIEQGALNKLLALWVVGANIDWTLLYGEQLPELLRLPTYPFAKTSYWLPTSAATHSEAKPISQEREPQAHTVLEFNVQGDDTIAVCTPSFAAENPVQAQPTTAQPTRVQPTLLHYTPNWMPKALESTAHSVPNRHVVLIGNDLAESLSIPSTCLVSTKPSIEAQLEDYTNQLVAFFNQLDTHTNGGTLIQVVIQDQTGLLSAINGVLKTAAIEYSHLKTQLLIVEHSNSLAPLLAQEAAQADEYIRYQGDQRHVLNFDLLSTHPLNTNSLGTGLQASNGVQTNSLPWKENGVYVITGGLGQLGQTFAKEIVKHTSHAQIIFVGRRALNADIQNQIDALKSGTTQLCYMSVDISDKIAVTQLFTELKTKYAQITGIIHSAGVIKDQLISNKTAQEVAQVFAPKVAGLVALDEASKAFDLDFFACFSSIAGVFGNMGQADYACANAYMDRFMANRQVRVQKGERFGLSLSINWPFWSQGGMQVDSLTQSFLHAQGIEPLSNAQGIDAFYRIFALASIPSQHCFLFGDTNKLTKLWHGKTLQAPSSLTTSQLGKKRTQLTAYIKSVIADITKIDSQDLDEDVDFKDMGFDSIMLMSVVQKLESDNFLDIDELPPTLLFEISTISGLSDYLAQHQVSPALQAPAIEREQPSISALMPLSKAQQGLWLLHKQNPTLSHYHVPVVFEVNSLDVPCMQDALNWLTKKHPILSLVMSEVEGLPQQQITALTPTLEKQTMIVDSKTALVELINQDLKKPFSLDDKDALSLQSQLLWRAKYWRVQHAARTCDVMALTFHHLIIDGVSATLLLEQLWQAYNARVSGQVLSEPQPDFGFFAYLDWEKQMLNGPHCSVLKHYWQTQLQGELPVLALPQKQQPTGVQKLAKRIELPINNVQVEKINQYCKLHAINPAAFFLSAFQTLLSAKTHSNDIILGVPVLHRPSKEMSNAMGLFVNQLPLRTQLNLQCSFAELAKTNQGQLHDLIKHSSYPFPEIVNALQAPRAMHSHPIFQMGFAYHNFLTPDWVEANQALVESLWRECLQEPELDLSLEVTPLPNTFNMAFKFDGAIYPSHVIDALAKDYLALLDEVMLNHNQKLDELRLFAPVQVSVQPTRQNHAQQHTLVELFDTQALKHPERTAVCFGMQSISYKALHDKANGFAHTLRAHPEFKQDTQNLVALCAQPSIELIVAILGILKAGAAYVPLDANSPAARISHILQDAQPSLVVLGADLPHAQTIEHHQVINLQTALSGHSHVTNINHAASHDLAYIIYTSGSTGKPKGVLVEHHSVCNLFDNTRALFGFNEQDTWCLFHSYAFDFSVWEIFGALLNGGKLLIPDELTRKESARFARFVIDNQVSILNQTPSAFYPLMDELLTNTNGSNALRKIIFGGEALDLNKLRPWFEHPMPAKQPELVNMYGITETTVHVTEVTIDTNLVSHHSNQSIIGRPLPGYSIHLLDAQLNPVVQGQVGEIYVGGCGVTRGYHNQTALTNERFINHPCGQRLYRSGDLARLNDTGLFEYIGRADEQVQIRGHRIELGEVQHALQSLSYISDAYVTAAHKQLGQVLVAYLIAPEAVPTTQVRADLLAMLPDYMVPSYFIYVPHLPLTANGKIDKQALLQQLPFNQTVEKPLANSALLRTESDPVLVSKQPTAAQSGLQTAITQIWQQVLEVEHVDAQLPFFEAGGNSLLANVLSAKFKSQLGIDFPITQIFQYSTIAAMTEYAKGLQQNNTIMPVETPTSTSAVTEQTQNVAVIGMSCQYPDSPDHRAFWHNLVEEKDLIKRLSESNEQGDITWLDSWIDGQDHFDPAFFNISEKNAKTMSYSQRQLLMHAWKAIEDAGYRPENMPNTGVYVSSSLTDGPDLNLQDKFKDGQFVLNAHDYVASTINQPGTLPTTISYHLGFNGPSLFVHSNCSSSMSAIALACSALKAKEIDYAIVGAACLYPQHYTGYQYEAGLNFAGDARCKVFDEKADGMIGGSGVSVIVLKRADDATRDADHIYSLIKGIKINNDGKDKAGFFAPGTQGQMSVIEQTLQAAKVSPASISYVEAHGTGTALGDPIEFSSLQQVYQKHSNDKQFCGLGGVKSNLGHTDTLAGLTGLIKTSLALHHKKLPASLHYTNANPHIELAQSPFYIVDRTMDWQTPLLPRRAAVSSFGIGGTNAHAILEEAPSNFANAALADTLSAQPSIIVLSAQSPEVLVKQVAQLKQYLAAHPLTEQQRVCLAYTLQTGRTVMPVRTGFVVNSISDLQAKLDDYLASPNFVQASDEAAKHNTNQESLTTLLEHGHFDTLLENWLENGDSNWDFLYQGAKLTKLSLPTYPFALKAMPLAHAQTAIAPQQSSANQVSDGTLLFKTPQWVTKPLNETSDVAASNNDAHHVVLCDMPSIDLPNATIHKLQSRHFAIEQKISDFGVQLVELIQRLASTKQPIKLQLIVADNGFEDTLGNLYCCFHALLKTASLECQAIKTQLLILNDGCAHQATQIAANIQGFEDAVVRYHQGNRQVLQYQLTAEQTAMSPFKPGGVYLITGGFGGIGRHFIQDLNSKPINKTVIVTGRKPLSHPDVQAHLRDLKHANTQLQYRALDVSHKMDVLLLVRDILAEHGTLSGVIHAAGIVRDTLLNKKDAETFKQVLAPKVTGVVALDEATQDIQLDFFACFAGLSGINGALTQIDYATANAFLDSYMHHRCALVKSGQRHGLSASIDWPYWQDGGMKINPDFANILSDTGFAPMPTHLGIEAFNTAIQNPQTLVEFTQHKSANAAKSETRQLAQFANSAALELELQNGLADIAANILGVEVNALDPNTDLGDLGADSIAFITFINQINSQYQLALSPSVLFMHSTLNGLVRHIIDEHSDKLLNQQSDVAPSNNIQSNEYAANNNDDRIAVIGMSAQFPKANNLEEFWQNLLDKQDCVSEFNWSGGPFPNEINWLGRLERNQTFDPLFFNIAPAESERIKLQESLLMTHVWKCIEDAGYDPKALAGTNTGLFIGCQASYHDGLVTSAAYAPNRMSYFLDLHGPSEGIDTTCSSSLVAIHKAIQSIRSGECDQAIVGGVNVIDSPVASLAMHDIGALSPTGRCRTFSSAADGIVRGEGVGMIFLKKLSQAEQDNDPIYGTLLGSAINHGGKSQGFTVPNAKAQTRLLQQAWKDANINPTTLSYIECHGTGTSLGDPVELDALKAAYKNAATDSITSHHCALGSVKSNIGHLEIAAGIAGVIKVLLQFKHQTLVPSLHVDELNPYLAIENSAFKVQSDTTPWHSEQPRRAGVSSFGISGVNAHLVLEEYSVQQSQRAPIHDLSGDAPAHVITLSATSKATLKHKMHELEAYLEAHPNTALSSLAYTLQVGRTAHQYRLGWTVSSIESLQQQLVQTLACDELSCHAVKGSKAPTLDDHNAQKLQHHPEALLRFWLEGKGVNWQFLYTDKPTKLHLPTTPFIAAEQKPRVANQTQVPWLLLNNQWQAQSLTCPTDWQSQLEHVLANKKVLIVAENNKRQAPLLTKLNNGHVETVLFAQLDTLKFTSDTLPDVVFFIGEQAHFESVQKRIQPLYTFMQAISPFDKHAMQLFYAQPMSGKHSAHDDISALLRSYTMRNSSHSWIFIAFANNAENWADKLLQELICPILNGETSQPNHIKYQDDRRFAQALQQCDTPAPTHVQFKQNGVYLIAGALGELGLALCTQLLREYDATLVLLGRRQEPDCAEALATLRALNKGHVHYLCADIASQNDLNSVKQFIDDKELSLNGLFHLGTVFTSDENSWDDFEHAMQVKVQGSLCLDNTFADAELDFFVMFASMAVFGSLNHLSYSYGNGFQNAFAAERQQAVKAGERHGKTLAINWGYWHSDDPVKSIENSFAQKKGYQLINMPEAFALMQSLLSSEYTAVGALLSQTPDKIYQNTARLLTRKTTLGEASALPKNLAIDSVEHADVRSAVIHVVSNVIGVPADELDLDCDLYEYGFDSISLLKTFAQLKAHLSIELQADAFKNMNTIGAFIDDIERLAQVQQNGQQLEVQPQPDFILDAGFTPKTNTTGLHNAFEGEVKSVLLTGATGFLGSHILQQLLDETNATMYCLVRATSLKQAKQRIVQAAKRYKLKIDMTRVVPLIGDMEQAQLGLSDKNWHKLCAQVQHIVHTASYVNHIQPYFAFKKSVAGTNQLLDIATTHSLKMLHFVSSTTASTQIKNSHFSVNPIEDFIEVEDAQLICSGYGQSKWVQEENIRQAAQAGVPYTIYRFAQISGSSKTGIGNTNDIFHRILKMLLKVPVKPAQSPYLLDIIPVDKAATAIVRGMNDEKKRNTVFHVANAEPLPVDTFYNFAETQHCAHKAVDKKEFIAACNAYIESLAQGNDRIIMQGLLTARPGYDEYLFESYLMPMSPYNKDNYLSLLANYEINAIDWRDLFGTYFEQWHTDKHYADIWQSRCEPSKE